MKNTLKKSYIIKLRKAKETFKALSHEELIWLQLPEYVDILKLGKKLREICLL